VLCNFCMAPYQERKNKHTQLCICIHM